MTIGGLLVLGVITIVIGFTCKYIFKRNKCVLEKYINCFNINSDVTQCSITDGKIYTFLL